MQVRPGQVAVVTGAASGIGLAFARALVARGLRVVVADINESLLTREADSIRAAGGEVLAVRTDVSRASEVEELAKRAWDQLGRVDLICNNAGRLEAALTWERTPADWARTLDPNLWGPLNMVHSFVPRMIAGGRPAHVVNVASVAAYAPRPGIAAYNISKAGVVALTESLVLDLLGVGADVGVSVVLPGKTATRLGRHILPTTADGEPAPAVAEADARSADDVAQQMVAAVERNQLYVFTHRERHAGVAARLNKVVAAFAGADLTPEELVLAEPDDVQRAIAQQLGTS